MKGRLYDAFRQSWVASPETEYVAAGNAPLRADVKDLQALLDAPRETVDVKGKPVSTVASGLSDAERQLFQSRGLLNAQGKITPTVLAKDELDAPKLFTRELWDAIYSVPKGDVSIEHIQHSFYMAANYGFQILNGNFAAAIDDYELKQRFMNDLATYRIYVSWLWALARHEAAITKDGHLQRQVLTEDGVVIGANAEPIKRARASPARCSTRSGTITMSGRARSSPSRIAAAILPLRSLQGGRHHGAPEAPAPLAPLRPAQRPRAVRRGAGELGGARRSWTRSSISRARRS